MLALMCSIYSAEGYIPKNLPEVYEKCSTMLFERWDKQRSIVVKLPFTAHIKPGLYALAAWMHGLPEAQGGVPRERIVLFISDFLYGRRFEDFADAEDAAERFMDFCTGRAWVLTNVGATTKEERYGFTHRTFMEYFAARQLTRDHPSPDSLFEALKPALVRASDDVVAQIALQVLGSNVSDASEDFLRLALQEVRSGRIPTEERVNVASFIVRALTSVVPPPAMVREIAGEIFDRYLNSERSRDSADGKANSAADKSYATAMYDLFCSTPENLEAIARELDTRIEEAVVDAIATRKRLPETLLRCLAYPLAFAQANTWAYATSIHQEVWASYGHLFRKHLARYQKAFRPIDSWEDYYLWCRVKNHTRGPSRLTLEHCFFTADYPGGLRQVSLAVGVLAVLRGGRLRDDILFDSITPRKAQTLCTELTRTDWPWNSTVGGREEWELSLSTRRANRTSGITTERGYLELLCLLSIYEVDLGRAIGEIDHRQRAEQWVFATANLFNVSVIASGDPSRIGEYLDARLSADVARLVTAWLCTDHLRTVTNGGRRQPSLFFTT